MTIPSWPSRAPRPPADPPTSDAARPESVTIALQLGLVTVICQLIVVFASYSTMRAQALKMAQNPELSGGGSGRRAIENVDQFATIVSVLSMTLLAVGIVVVAGAAAVLLVKGYGWVRFVVAWLAGVIALSLIFDVLALAFGGSEVAADSVTLPSWTMVPRIIGGVAAIGVFLAMMHADTRRYGEQGAARRNARRQPPGPEGGLR